MRLGPVLMLALFGCDDGSPAKDDRPDGTTPGDDDDDDTTATSPPTDPAVTALAALSAASATPVTVHVANGVPSAVYLQIPLDAGDVVEDAYTFLQTYADLYGLDDARAQLWPTSYTEATGRHLRFVQRTTPDQGGLPLFDSNLTLHLGEDGTLYMTTGRWVPNLRAAPPVLGFPAAIATAAEAIGLRDLEVAGEPQLGIVAEWPELGAPVLTTVWRTTVTGYDLATGGAGQWRVDVDAVTGALVQRRDLVATCDRDFDIMYGSHTDAAATCWAGWADTEDWFDEDGPLSDYSGALDHNSDGWEAYDHAHDVFTYYALTLGLCSYDGDDAEVEMVTHAAIENASASGFCGTMQFRDDFTTLDIVAHEFTHLVDYNHEDLEYEGQSGALDESFADVMACMIDRNWTIGEGLDGGAIRDLSDPTLHQDPDHFSQYISGGDVHDNSGIPNKAAYLVTAGGQHNGYAIQGIGWSKAEKLYHFAHIGSLGDDDTFRDARNALVGTALYWGGVGAYGFDFDDWCQVANAYAAVGVGVTVADSDCDGTPDGDQSDDDGDGHPDGQDVCPQMPDLAQWDSDGDGMGDACDDDDDQDNVPDNEDNCPVNANGGQGDRDGDGRGDVCDDDDGDGLLDDVDNCPSNANWNQADQDGDGLGDACDGDIDNDGAPNDTDNCPTVANADQAEYDGDGFGDVCDVCPLSWNPDQDGCACPVDFLQQAECNGAFDPEESVFVHPLDKVSLPWLADVRDLNQLDDYRLSLTIIGTGEPWVVTDQLGNVIAKSSGVIGPTAAIQVATWPAATDYVYAEGGVRPSFTTDYTVEFGPTTVDEASVRLEMTAELR